MNVRSCALIVFGADTSNPIIVAMEEATIDAISQSGWVVLARDSEMGHVRAAGSSSHPAQDADRSLDR